MIVSSLRHFFRFVFESRLDVKSSLLTYDFAEKEKENKQIKNKKQKTKTIQLIALIGQYKTIF